jgi:hypothetical protein
LKEAFKVVHDNGGLDISGEYGSLEINDNDFEPHGDSRAQYFQN